MNKQGETPLEAHLKTLLSLYDNESASEILRAEAFEKLSTILILLAPELINLLDASKDAMILAGKTMDRVGMDGKAYSELDDINYGLDVVLQAIEEKLKSI